MPISNWKLTFDPDGASPLVVLDYGDKLESEFAMPWRQVIQESVSVRGPNKRRFARENISNGVEFSVRKDDHAGDQAAREWMLDLQLTLADFSGVTATLKLEIAGSTRVALMANATLDDVVSRRVLHPTKAVTLTAWTIGGAGWSEVP